jgi:hypothetical protein
MLIKEILHGVNFYWKKFIILSIFFLLIMAGLWYWQNQTKSEAYFVFSNEPQFQTIAEQNYDIQVKKNGKVLVNGKDATKDLKIYKDYYQVQVMLVDSPGSYIDRITATMTLPKDVSEDQIKQIVYAVHGVGSYDSKMIDSHTLFYEADNVSSQSTVSIAAQLPKSILKPSIFKQLSYWIRNIPANEYTLIAGILPLISLFVMLFMIIKRRKDQIISLRAEPVAELPSPIPPAIAGVLVDGQVSAREIAATLIDLANRGYIFIVQRDNYFTFGKRKSINLEDLPELRSFEHILLGKIFNPGDYKSTKADVEMRVGHHIFSRKIAQVFLEIYNEATNMGYFIKNPASVHRRWRYTGIVLFFFGLLGFIQSALWAPDPKFTLIFWVGEMMAASVITKLSGLMPARSASGSRALDHWMAFRKYLKMNKPIEGGATIEDRFNKLLPYAIVYGVEDEWAKRFMDTTFAKPDWYEAINDVSSLELFIGGLYPLINFVGQILAGSHDPTVE